MEDHLHIEEFKIRLTPADGDLLRALARKKGIPPAVLARAMVIEALGPAMYRVPAAADKRRPA